MTNENLYLKKFLDPIKVCRRYKPKFGLGNKEGGLDLAQFLSIYGADPFYSWIGLDSSLMYAAHKAAGGMTSIYRQIGKGCENLFRQIIINQTQYEDLKYALWSYTTKTKNNRNKTLSLDARLELNEIRNIDPDLMLRYQNSRGGIIIGTTFGSSQISLFVFSKEILGYDLADFFHRNSEVIKSEVYSTLEILLRGE